MKYSVNPNLNAVMNSIEKLLLSKGKDKQESIQIIKRYIKSFPKEPDYNLAQHGGMLVSPYDVRELNIKCARYLYLKFSGFSSFSNLFMVVIVCV